MSLKKNELFLLHNKRMRKSMTRFRAEQLFQVHACSPLVLLLEQIEICVYTPNLVNFRALFHSSKLRWDHAQRLLYLDFFLKSASVNFPDKTSKLCSTIPDHCVSEVASHTAAIPISSRGNTKQAYGWLFFMPLFFSYGKLKIARSSRRTRFKVYPPQRSLGVMLENPQKSSLIQGLSSVVTSGRDPYLEG